jgi:uncharacterized protein
MDKIQEIIRTLGLIPLTQEGGLYVQTYRSSEMIPQAALPAHYNGPRSFGTAIFYLMTADADSFSALHRVETDEIYHFYLGDAVELLLLLPGGASRRVILGPKIMEGQQVQFVVPAGAWQGSRLLDGGDYALLGTTMAPGFDRADFALGERRELVTGWPQEDAQIVRLTRG